MVFFKWVHFFIIFHFFTSTTPIYSDSISTKFLDLAKKPEVFDWMVQIRRKLHEYPELLYEEFKTSEVIREELDKLGIPYESQVAVTGVIGFIGTRKPPFVAIRADMDGLPIQEMVEWEHKSKVPGKMHACGHDAHVAMLLGAAKILKEHEKEIQGTVVLVFQPAEEGGAGAKQIAETQTFKDISAIFGLHVAPMLPIGEVASRSGPLMAGSSMFEAIITGKGGHGAMPHQAIDPVVATSSVIARLQQIVSREADPLDSQVVSVTILQGGDAFNVIPESVKIGGTFRALKQESLAYMRQRIEQIIISQAAVERCNATVDFHDSKIPPYPATTNPSELHEHFLNVAEGMIGSKKVHEIQPVMASEDFAFYQQVKPGYFFFLGIQHVTPVHSPFFIINEDAFPYGAALHASLATSYIRKLQQDNQVVVEGKHHDEF